MSDQKSPDKMTDPIAPKSQETAHELDFDDEPQETGVVSSGDTVPMTAATEAPKPGSGEDVAPPKPPRPMSPQQQAEATLKEAFPSIDVMVVRAVLTASGGRVEPAFNALLGMSDPDSQTEPAPPPQPPRPAQPPLGATSTAQSQLEADEQYARQLADDYGGAPSYVSGPKGGSRGARDRADPPMPRPRKETGLKPNELYDDKEHSFLDDDLPVIQENIRKGFLETQSKVNRWVTSLKKRIDGDDEEGMQGRPTTTAQGYNPSTLQQTYGTRRSSDFGRRSGDRERYDADPRVLSDNFEGLELRDDETQQRRSTRPLANPDLFKPTPRTPQSLPRKVSFQDGPPEDIDALYRSTPKPINRQPSPATTSKQSKWQPLSSVDPSPVADHDPFSLGDSDDEREARSKDLKAGDSDRLKKAAAEAMEDDIGSGTKNLEAHQISGTKDKEAEEKLTGTS